MNTDPLIIAAFLDTRPGHRKQTSGVLAALCARTPCSVHDFHLPEYGPASSAADWARLAGCLAGFPVTQPHLSSGRILPERFDLIIGTGSHTHPPMIMLKKRKGGRLVTCMSPDPVLAPFFDLCIVPAHDRPKARKNVFTTLGPPNPSPKDGPHEIGKWLVLVGGVDPKSHFWDSGETLRQISEIASRRPDASITVSSSPRTPPEMLDALDRLNAVFPNVRFFRSSDTPKGWVEERYAESSVAWVTADSVSMIYEALTAGCAVGVLPVEWKKPAGKIPYGLDRLREKNLVIDFETWRKNPGQLRPASTGLDEAGRAADEILSRFFPGRIVYNSCQKSAPIA